MDNHTVRIMQIGHWDTTPEKELRSRLKRAANDEILMELTEDDFYLHGEEFCLNCAADYDPWEDDMREKYVLNHEPVDMTPFEEYLEDLAA